jgi:2-methylisocitrate lyase-like PEP mutase family enzyme
MTHDSLDSLTQKARLLRSLHGGAPGGPVLVLPNAWDAASAVMVQAAGARAVATTSAGVAWALGRQDGQRITREDMIYSVRRIAAAVDVPVTADVEGGYGPDPADVEATVRAVVDAGAVGVNLEDSTAPGGPLFGVDEQVERIRAARESATAAGLPDLVVNARTDVFLYRIGEPDGRLDQVRARFARYAEAGADCLFVPGLLDLAALRAIVAATPLPVNVMAGPGGPGVVELAAVGVRRVSAGPTIARAAYSVARAAAHELLSSGSFSPACRDALGFDELERYFARG